MITFETVVAMIEKEYEYAKGWAKGGRKISKVEGVEDHDVHPLPPLTGTPYSVADFMVFADKYLDEARQAMQNFTPDGGAVRIRVLKAVGLLIRALMVHGRENDLARIAGVSSRDFPVIGGGLKTFDESTTDEGCLITSKDTGKLRDESHGCDPLR